MAILDSSATTDCTYYSGDNAYDSASVSRIGSKNGTASHVLVTYSGGEKNCVNSKGDKTDYSMKVELFCGNSDTLDLYNITVDDSDSCAPYITAYTSAGCQWGQINGFW